MATVLPPPQADEYDTFWPGQFRAVYSQRKGGGVQINGYIKCKKGQESKAEALKVIRHKGDVVVAIDGVLVEGLPFLTIGAMLKKRKDFYLRMRCFTFEVNSKTTETPKSSIATRTRSKTPTESSITASTRSKTPTRQQKRRCREAAYASHDPPKEQPLRVPHLPDSSTFIRQPCPSLSQTSTTLTMSTIYDQQEVQLKEEINHHREEIARLQQLEKFHRLEMERKEELLQEIENETIAVMENRLQELKQRAANRNLSHENVAGGSIQRAEATVNSVTDESSSFSPTNSLCLSDQVKEPFCDDDGKPNPVSSSPPSTPLEVLCGQKRKAPPSQPAASAWTKLVDPRERPPPQAAMMTVVDPFEHVVKQPYLHRLPSSQGPLPTRNVLSGSLPDSNPFSQPRSAFNHASLPRYSQSQSCERPTMSTSSSLSTASRLALLGPRMVSNLPAWMTQGVAAKAGPDGPALAEQPRLESLSRTASAAAVSAQQGYLDV